MRKYSNEELEQILDNIKSGATYCGIHSTGYGIGRIYETPFGNLGWQHYGQSAEKMTIRDLRWLLETIFADMECVTPAEWSDYHINYVPIDKQYKGIDHSTKHPNVCGL